MYIVPGISYANAQEMLELCTHSLYFHLRVGLDDSGPRFHTAATPEQYY